MKKSKVFITLILVIVIAIGSCVCMIDNSAKNQVNVAQKLLEEKYNKEFQVNAIGERFGTLTNNTYKVQCYPVDNVNDVFIAEIGEEGNLLYDDYVSVCVCRKVREIIKEELGSTTEVLVESRPSITDETNPNISFEDFVKNNQADFVVYVVTKDDFSKIKEKFDSFAEANNSVNIELRAYCEKSDEQLSDFKAAADKGNRMNSEIKFILDDLPQIIKYTNGVGIEK